MQPILTMHEALCFSRMFVLSMLTVKQPPVLWSMYSTFPARESTKGRRGEHTGNRHGAPCSPRTPAPCSYTV